MYLTNPTFSSASNLYLLYSTAYSGTSFEQIAYALKGYKAPTFIIVKHVDESNKDTRENKGVNIFGGFSMQEWVD